jgi:hypothetical protein
MVSGRLVSTVNWSVGKTGQYGKLVSGKLVSGDFILGRKSLRILLRSMLLDELGMNQTLVLYNERK